MDETIFYEISSLIDIGDFLDAEKKTLVLLAYMDSEDDGSEFFASGYSNAAGFLVDIAHGLGKKALAVQAISIFQDKNVRIQKVVGLHQFYYNLANAKSNLIIGNSTFDLSFSSIEILVEAKNLYWKSIKEARKNKSEFPEQYVNLANCLKRQFRLSEALWHYDLITKSNPEIPQTWINRSEALLMLNTISNSYSIKMLHEVSKGYSVASKSSNIPPSYATYYHKKALQFKQDISEEDHSETQIEFQELSDYRKFCCLKQLTLSEHGLYCVCAGTARDNLTIPMQTTSIGGNFVPQMEAVLNRLKSEYSMARQCYFEYSTPTIDFNELIHEECFTDLQVNECLGINFEKLRTAFRLCFGILDKIAIAICEHYSLKPKKGMIYFHNFWQLDQDERRSKFEAIKDPGLLALYSIATDLNKHKQGEWKDFKRFRNAMEHGFLVITHSGELSGNFDSYNFSSDIEHVDLHDFEQMVEQMLQLVRSAIFSFVFSFKDKGLKLSKKNGVNIPFQRINPSDYT